MTSTDDSTPSTSSDGAAQGTQDAEAPGTTDDVLWADVVAAQRELARVGHEFRQHAQDRPGVLSRALRARSWDTVAALDFLDNLGDDVPRLLDDLIEVTLDDGYGLKARCVIDNESYTVGRQVREKVLSRLDTADGHDVRRLAELLLHLRDAEGLQLLVATARQSDDPDVREVAGEYDPT
jgi:hypothetical protein